MGKPSIVFMGTPDFAVPTLKVLFEAGYPIKTVYSQPPRPVGRGHKVQLSPVHHFTLEHHLKVLTPSSLRYPESQKEFAELQADFAVVVAYGLILPKEILAATTYGCINVHASLLPRWRGAAPIQRAILAGDQKTGVTIMQMDEGLDTGPMILQEEINLTSETTGQSLHDKLANLGADLILPALEGLLTGRIIPQPQPQKGVTYAAKLTKEEAFLDWRKPAQQLERQVRAFMTWPGSCFVWEGEKIKVLQASYESFSFSSQPGEVIDSDLLVACAHGALRLIELQRPGKSALKARDFLNGMPLPKGTQLDTSNDSL